MSKKYPNKPYSLSDTLKKRNNEYFGRYRGTVLDNEDPDERGRCKVFVYGVYDEGFNKDKGKRLPWAEPCQPLFCGGKGDDGANGVFQCPDIGSTVYVFFDSGDISHPVMFGKLTDKNGKFSTKHCKLKWEKMSIDLCRDNDNGTNVISLSAQTDINEIANDNNINRNAGNTINDSAKITINITGIDKDVNIKAGADINIYAKNNVNIKSAKQVNINGESEINIKSPKITINGETVINGNCHITGKTEIDSAAIIHSNGQIDSDVKIGGKSFLSHTHTGNLGNPTSPPL